MKKKIIGLLILLAIYVAALGIGIGSMFLFTGLHIYLAILLADVIATVFVWLMGLIVKTPSAYDPYWSVQTFFIYLGLLIYYNNWNVFTIIPLVVIFIYSYRLTANFVVGFHDLTYIDWRYRMLAEKSGKLFQLVNLFGICMFPTLVVYAASLPLIQYALLSEGDYSWLDIVGSVIILGGVLLELFSDIQMKQFIKTRKDRSEIINIGIWKYSRHPNYLGEISIWFGVALILIIRNYTYWYLIAGAVINLLMFLFISIPMEERHMAAYKPDLPTYKKTTSMLLLLPRRKIK